MIATCRQLLTTLHEQGHLSNWDEQNGGFDEALGDLAAEAKTAGLIKISIGWGDDQYYYLTNAGRAYIGVPEVDESLSYWIVSNVVRAYFSIRSMIRLPR